MISSTEHAREGCSFRFFLIGLAHWVRRGFKPLSRTDGQTSAPGPSWGALALVLIVSPTAPVLLVRLLPYPHALFGLTVWLLGMVFLASYGVWTLLHLIICTTSSFYQARCQEGRVLSRMQPNNQRIK